MDQFEVISLIGEGTYGQVFKAKHRPTGKLVAIKKFKESDHSDDHVRKTVLREIRVLKDFKHPNIVKLLQVFRAEEDRLFLVFEYVEKTVLEELETSPEGIPLQKLKSMAYQMLMAIDFMHENEIIHRDVKPENLLVSNKGLLKVCDFGFARSLLKNSSAVYTDYVSTRWYRAPELLMGDANYNKSVDTWAIGCIYAEMFNGMPLFPGDSDLHTLKLILEMFGDTQTLTEKQINAFLTNPIYDGMTQLPEPCEGSSKLRGTLEGIDDDSLDFIERCLQLDPSQRWSAKQLMNHPLFEKIAGFKEKLQSDMAAWSSDEDLYNSEMAELMEIHNVNDAILHKTSNDPNAQPARRSSIPEEFCNVSEMLAKIELRSKSMQDIQPSYGQYSVGDEQIEEEEDDSSRSDMDDSAGGGCGSSSAVGYSKVSKQSGYDHHMQQVYDDEDGQSNIAVPKLLVDEGTGIGGGEVPQFSHTTTDEKLEDISKTETQQQTAIFRPANFNNTSSHGSLQDESEHLQDNGPFEQASAAREIIVQQLSQQHRYKPENLSQLSSKSQHPNQQAAAYTQANSRSVAYPIQHLSMHQDHNKSLEVIIESPPNAVQQNIAAQSVLATHNNNNNISSIHQSPPPQQSHGMLLSSQNGNIKSLSTSIKQQQKQYPQGNAGLSVSGFSPGTRMSNKFSTNAQSQQHSGVNDLHRNNSQEIMSEHQRSVHIPISLHTNNFVNVPNQSTYFNNQQQLHGIKKINITFSQYQQPPPPAFNDPHASQINHHLMRDSIHHQHASNASDQANSPKLKQAYTGGNKAAAVVVSQSHSQSHNAFVRRNPNYMNQTARDQTPVKLNQHMHTSTFKAAAESKQAAIIYNHASPIKSLKKGASSLEKIVYDSPAQQQALSKSPPVKLPTMRPQVSNVQINGSHIPMTLTKQNAAGYGVQYPNSIFQHQHQNGSKYLGNSPPLKAIALPKLIDQIKESENHQSFIKLNQIIAIQENAATVTQSVGGTTFNNQFLNDSIRVANKQRQGGGGAGQTTSTKESNSMTRVSEIYGVPKNGIYGGIKTEKQNTGSLYEMDSFPRRSITNRLKNVQILQNKKKIQAIFNERQGGTTLFPHITTTNQASIPINGNVNVKVQHPMASMQDQSIKIIDLQHSILPSGMTAVTNDNYSSKKHEVFNGSITTNMQPNKMKGGLVGAAGGGFFKPKTPADALNDGSNLPHALTGSPQQHLNGKSPNMHDKGASKLALAGHTPVTTQPATLGLLTVLNSNHRPAVGVRFVTGHGNGSAFASGGVTSHSSNFISQN